MDAQKHRLAKFGLTVPSEMEAGDDDCHQGKKLQIEYTVDLQLGLCRF